MKRFFRFVFILIFLFAAIGKNNAGTIVLTDSSLQFKQVSLAGTFADDLIHYKNLSADESGRVVFITDSLVSGIYYLIYPDSSSIEFLFDQTFEEKIHFKNSKEQGIQLITSPSPVMEYHQYNTQMVVLSIRLDSIRILLKQVDLKSREQQNLLEERDRIYDWIDVLLKEMAKEGSSEFLRAFFKTKLVVEIPDFDLHDYKGDKDSLLWVMQREYYTKHFLDRLDLADYRLLHTPAYTSMVNEYLDKVLPQQIEILTQTVNRMIESASRSENTYAFLSQYLLKKYSLLKNTEPYESVYLYLIEQYFLQKTHPSATNNDVLLLTKEHNSRKPLLIGQPAPTLKLSDENGKVIDTDSIQSKYLLLYFYQTDCELCQQTTPQMKKLSWLNKNDSLTVVSVCMGTNNESCKNYIQKNGLTNWVNLMDENQIHLIANSYNLRYTPCLYLLDSEKKIRAKNITVQQLEDILEESER
ncbi:MAG: redoxin domain-containing protein [Bacteroidota bacterium]|nr:MAG: redoxin domain-containing protein [Bacteroidota bacterium]